MRLQSTAICCSLWLACVAAHLVNLQDYNPIGDGVTDDGPAFQRAFDELREGGVLYVPEAPTAYFIDTRIRSTFTGRLTVSGNDNVFIIGSGSFSFTAAPAGTLELTKALNRKEKVLSVLDGSFAKEGQIVLMRSDQIAETQWNYQKSRRPLDRVSVSHGNSVTNSAQFRLRSDERERPRASVRARLFALVRFQIVAH